MFKVRAKVIKALGDESKYPCHFNYKPGDEVIWTGAELKGRICPAVLGMLAQKMQNLYSAGPRYREPAYYHPFWYTSPSVYDPAMKKYDGIGFKPVLKTMEDPEYDMANLRPADAYKWPPHPERTVVRDATVTCPDLRTAMLFKLEAYDLAEDGDCVTFFRRYMCIMDRIFKKQELAVDDIFNEFTREETEGIYPALSPILVNILVEDLELMGYVELWKGKTRVTKKGEAKLEDFRKSLSTEERKALRI